MSLSTTLKNIANAIRSKTGSTSKIIGNNLATEITNSLQKKASGTLSITSNGTKDVTNYANVNVNVPASVSTITLNFDNLASSEVILVYSNASGNVVTLSTYGTSNRITVLANSILTAIYTDLDDQSPDMLCDDFGLRKYINGNCCYINVGSTSGNNICSV